VDGILVRSCWIEVIGLDTSYWFWIAVIGLVGSYWYKVIKLKGSY